MVFKSFGHMVDITTHLELLGSLLQSYLTIIKECGHLTLAKEVLDLVSLLLCLNKGMNLVKGSR